MQKNKLNLESWVCLKKNHSKDLSESCFVVLFLSLEKLLGQQMAASWIHTSKNSSWIQKTNCHSFLWQVICSVRYKCQFVSGLQVLDWKFAKFGKNKQTFNLLVKTDSAQKVGTLSSTWGFLNQKGQSHWHFKKTKKKKNPCWPKKVHNSEDPIWTQECSGNTCPLSI